MKLDMTPFFKKYEALADKVESVFEVMKKKYPEEVRCAPGCTDCCYALFDLTLIEAVYVNHMFQKKFSGARKEQLLETSNKVDRRTYKIKKAAYKAKQKGKGEEEIIEDVGKERVRCAMLNDENVCDIYEFRPIACRLDGIPVAVGGKGRTCPLSGFSSGQSYPTQRVWVFGVDLAVARPPKGFVGLAGRIQTARQAVEFSANPYCLRMVSGQLKREITMAGRRFVLAGVEIQQRQFAMQRRRQKDV